MIEDRDVKWVRKRIYIGVNEFTGWKADQFLGAGNVDFEEVSDFTISAVKSVATTDVISDMRPFPADFDTAFPVYFRVYWTTASATTTDGVTIRIRHTAIADGEVMTSGAQTALDTAIAEDTVEGLYFFHKTAWGSLDGGTFTDGDMLIMEIMCTATDTDITGSEYLYYLGYEIEYTPKSTSSGDGMVHEALRAYDA